jgi:hypothetical protein
MNNNSQTTLHHAAMFMFVIFYDIFGRRCMLHVPISTAVHEDHKIFVTTYAVSFATYPPPLGVGTILAVGVMVGYTTVEKRHTALLAVVIPTPLRARTCQ